MALGPQRVAPELLAKVTKTLGISSLEQWYYVSHHAATQAIGVRAINAFGGTLASFLKSAYPSHHFDEEKFKSIKNQERDQKFIEVVIRKLFPNAEIQTKARKAVGIINPQTNAYLEIDFWIPSLKLGIEYQDKHHYGYQWYANAALEDYQKRDSIKKHTMASRGYTLITIGYWWDKSIESVAATIRKSRPDLLREYENNSAVPIAQDPPEFSVSVIPGVDGIMSPFIPGNNFDPTNWYAGEKHDGVRGVYNPEMNKMFSRSGKELSVLPALLQDTPEMLVEGEIIAGRGNYSKTAAISRHTHHDEVDWSMFRYVIYDIPNAELGDYTQRYSEIARELTARPYIFAQSAFRVLVVDKSHLKMLADSIICDAGEGMIVQKDSPYEYGRATGLAKIKVRRDADALVIRVLKRSCTCKLTSGGTASINFCDGFDPSQLKKGDIISYYHNGNSKYGKPKQAEIYKVRYDVTWEQLVNDKAQNVAKRRSVTEAIGSSSLNSRDKARNKVGHWNNLRNVRAFLDEFARTSGFDPLSSKNWYSVSTTTLRNAGGGGLLGAYGYSLMKALSRAYPDLKFEEAKFRTYDKERKKRGHWTQLSNVRAFLDDFARKAGFDPLVPDNWRSIKPTSLDNSGGSGLLSAYNFDLTKALSCAYPKLKFEAIRTSHAKDTLKERNKIGHWNEVPNVRAFFDEFARTYGFDPLVLEKWYSVTSSEVQKLGGGGIFNHYSLAEALSRAYPELQFDPEIFRTGDKTRGHWNKEANIRSFFDDFARTSGFDPLVPDKWYPVKTRALRNAGGGGILKYYSMMKALSQAYPELKFEAEKFRS